MTLDSHLTWTNHIDKLCSTINSRLALLRRIKPFLTKDCALRFYNSCIHANIIYCSVTWGNCFKTLLQRILRLQKCAACIILDADYSTPSVLLFSPHLKFIPIFDLIKFRKLLLLLNILINPNAPRSISYLPLDNTLVQEPAYMTLSSLTRVLILVNEHFSTAPQFSLMT